MSPLNSVTPLTSAMEDYLEVIYHLEQESRIARVRDIAKRLGVKMSSVSSALKILGARGLIRYDPHQFITLTDKGIFRAKEIVRKHEILKRFLSTVLQINDNVAEDNACRIEHYLDPEVINKLIRFLEFVQTCPVDQSRWMEINAESCNDCLSCLEEARKRIQNRAIAQKVALAGGMKLAEAAPGTMVVVQQIDGHAEFRESLGQEGLTEGVTVEIESVKESSRDLNLNINGYHVTINKNDALKIFVKPV
ncbi:MAG: metal-dependent transcriptional regulator [Deltaproteobacteria bacterium]|nr:metal-dependent transcriptional regulator [Deltaproteobacteria bacterium]